jgi:hypothetical protein
MDIFELDFEIESTSLWNYFLYAGIKKILTHTEKIFIIKKKNFLGGDKFSGQRRELSLREKSIHWF